MVHTDGSAENAILLSSKLPTLAIMQYDVALGSRTVDYEESVYGLELPTVEIPGVDNNTHPEWSNWPSWSQDILNFVGL